MSKRLCKISILILLIVLLMGLAACNASGTDNEYNVNGESGNSLEVFINKLLGISNAPPQYNVTFYTGPGKNVATQTASIVEEEPKTSLDNHDFGGWYYNSDFTGSRVSFPFNVPHDITLYARYYRQYSIMFETNGGSSLDRLRAGLIDSTPITTRAGFNFEGWFTTPDFSTPRIEFPYVVPTDQVFYAKWITAGAYQIETAEQLLNIRFGLDSANVYTLANDINLNNIEIEPIGAGELPFKGTFNGAGFTVSNFKISESEFFDRHFGLFGSTEGATINNLKVKDAVFNLSGEFSLFYAGGIVGYSKNSTINNCEIINADFLVNGRELHLGGIVGTLDGGSITNSSSSGNIRSRTADQKINLGGIVGSVMSGTVENCTSNAMLRGRIAGGIVGSNEGTIRNCTFSGQVANPLSYTSDETSFTTIIGGIAGNNYEGGLITLSQTLQGVLLEGRYVGGIAGMNGVNASITNSISYARINADKYAGGITAHNESGTIRHCVNRGIVEAKAIPVRHVEGQNEYYTGGSTSSVYAGGIVGYNSDSRHGNGIIDRSFNFNTVNAISIRPGVDGSNPQLGDFNPAYAGAVVGHSMSDITSSYNYDGVKASRNYNEYLDDQDKLTLQIDDSGPTIRVLILKDNQVINNYEFNYFFNQVIGLSSAYWEFSISNDKLVISMR